MKYKEFEKILEKFEMKNLSDFSISYSANSKSRKMHSSDEKISDAKDDEIMVVTPIDQTLLARIAVSDRLEYDEKTSILKKAQNEWLLFTDADCRVSSLWVSFGD